ncbi:MAG TPA: ABC transporter permease, partial [Streptosporangiaceae bacterium]|nr:ABC transporter permease [Streptosporangiaceae bacterium]
MPEPVGDPVEVSAPPALVRALPGGLGSPDGTVTAAVLAPEAVLAAREGLTIEARGQFRMAAERFLHHRVAMAGLVIFVLLLLVSTVAPLFWRYSYAAITNQFASGPSLQHPFGTDTIGHDLFAQVLQGTATSIKIALLVAVIATVLGTLVGAFAGYYGKLADAALMRFTDLVLVVPLIAILLVLANGTRSLASSWFWISIVLGLVLWTYLARLVRSSFLSLREREFVEAEWAIGASDFRIIMRH